MRGRLEEARPCVLVTCIYRDGSPRLWPLMFPRDGEKDNTAWSPPGPPRGSRSTSGCVWSGASGPTLTRDALPGYAPDPDWKKLPAFNELVQAAFGPHGVIQDTAHPIYRELMGAPATVNADDDRSLIGAICRSARSGSSIPSSIPARAWRMAAWRVIPSRRSVLSRWRCDRAGWFGCGRTSSARSRLTASTTTR